MGCSRVGDYTALIFTWNRLTDLKRCIESVRAQTIGPSELIVIDNASTDGTTAWLAQEEIEWYSVRRKHLAHIFNEGWKKARGQLIMFLADDAELSPTWVEEALPVLYDQSVAAVTGRLISTTSYASEMHRLYVVAQRSPFLRPLLRAYVHFAMEDRPLEPCQYFESGAYSFGQALDQVYEDVAVADLLTTTSMLIRRDVLKSLGGFDERFWFNHADGDLFLRISRAGWSMRFQPRSRALHHVRLGPSRDPYIIGRDTAVFHAIHLRPKTLRGWVGAALNIAILNLYWIYAAFRCRDINQLAGLAGYLLNWAPSRRICPPPLEQ